MSIYDEYSDINPLLKRALLFLEDGDFEKADNYCDKVLDQEPENALAYFGKLLAELNLKTIEELADYSSSFDDNNNYKKTIRFADSGFSEKLVLYNKKNKYNNALIEFNAKKYDKAAELFNLADNYLDAKQMKSLCFQKKEEDRKDKIYNYALTLFEKAESNTNKTYYQQAIEKFETINDWKNSKKLIETCKNKIREIELKEESNRINRQIKAEEEQKANEKKKARNKRIAIISSSILVICIAFLIVLTTVIIPNNKYNKAINLLDLKDYETAYRLLEEIGKNELVESSKYERAIDYLNLAEYDKAYVLLNEIGKKELIVSNKRERALEYINSGDSYNAYLLLTEICDNDTLQKYPNLKIQYANVGNIIEFGTYEQDNNSSSKEKIEWVVLEVRTDKLLLISKMALDCKKYNSSKDEVTWENCTLRNWLNESFLNDAFSLNEQERIVTTTVSSDKNPAYNISSGNVTNDKIFLLSVSEAKKYFSYDDSRKCVPTEYAKSKGVYLKSGSSYCIWWLRTPGYGLENASGVDNDGVISYLGGYYVNRDQIAVRPAIWISKLPN